MKNAKTKDSHATLLASALALLTICQSEYERKALSTDNHYSSQYNI